ncbi:transmembrane protein, putative (macronuclear) [Tetrahymena thermophila SB210]|uniref:Transmembrane protein, putative n=1 Tax=Tetrahymena thermophila (strain SB210) TaxID=312017 RepID=Q22PG3_TETTS|nr:transmembrane protein, putative [Tetrahymena thermophila SB210]EAR87146.2 transmembrane protein, putative [Tetrahymena thermophila SB210]|eukprot:XP_001007391.2 transmembrane protein, putative [Tetrahymena thermophila SB210]
MIWKPKKDLTRYYNCYNFCMFFLGGSIFCVSFFLFMNPTASLTFIKANNCQVIGQQKNYIEQAEKYSILYINFEYQGKQFLGQACSSDLNQSDVFDGLGPYKFYYKHDQISCGSEDESFKQHSKNRIFQEDQKNEANENYRFLGADIGDDADIDEGESIDRGLLCKKDYLWSNVKIASWLCLPNNFNIADYMEPQSCFVNFFEGERAFQSGIDRAPMRDQNNFPLISYEQQAYYPKTHLICIIIFTYYNWILSLNTIFQYTSNAILKILQKNKLLIG